MTARSLDTILLATCEMAYQIGAYKKPGTNQEYAKNKLGMSQEQVGNRLEIG